MAELKQQRHGNEGSISAAARSIVPPGFTPNLQFTGWLVCQHCQAEFSTVRAALKHNCREDRNGEK